MQRCPCCRARLKEAQNCPRCKADLSQVYAVEQASRYWYQQAVEHWLKEEPLSAATALKKSLQFKKTELALAFESYIIEQQCKKTINLLLVNDISNAEQAIASVQTLQVTDFERKLYYFTQSGIPKIRISPLTSPFYRYYYLKLRKILLSINVRDWLSIKWRQKIGV